ncbi:hypothetical protein HFO32_22210 [Rhizobium leguminosarum]|uniref:hypothetical protein n=1 Tax=Rhizobium leguminosarum TaxID=384 RepID=UPI001C982C76|nr:hypothetical protein [Rhizobium leguminosarum]MBY5684840.1 hypothetical protein [Rhizobium leguminosarum]
MTETISFHEIVLTNGTGHRLRGDWKLIREASYLVFVRSDGPIDETMTFPLTSVISVASQYQDIAEWVA